VARVTNLVEKNNLRIKIKSNDKWLKSLGLDYDNYRFDLVIKNVMNKLQDLDKYITKTTPWKVVKKGKLKRILTKAVNEIYLVSEALIPFMPKIAQQVIDTITAEQIKKAPPLFPRIDSNNS